jgi:hypothetical protein
VDYPIWFLATGPKKKYGIEFTGGEKALP